MINENEKKKIVHQRVAYQKSLSEVARMFGTSRIQIRKIEAEYLKQLKENKMSDDLLDESLFDEVFETEPECNCECGCKVPVLGQCVDCGNDTGHQNNNGFPKYDYLNELIMKEKK